MFASKVPFPVEGYPFLFTYGRKCSDQLLLKWDFECAEGMLAWADPDTGLCVRADVIEYPDTGAIEWVLTFTNSGTKPTPILEDVQALRGRVPGQPGFRESALLHRNRGDSCKPDDWLPYTTEIAPGTWTRFGPNLGRPSNGALPFFNFEWCGRGVITAIGWTGQWKAQLVWGTMAEIRAGMEFTHLSLLPGESIRTPRVMQLYWEGDVEQSYNLFRQHMLKHVFPRIDGELTHPLIAHLTTTSWEWNSSSEESVLEHLDAIKDLGFEVLWLDAYYMPGGFPWGIGNVGLPATRGVAADRYPRGLGYLADKAHEAGMEWLVWHEPERVAEGTYLDKEHPEFLLSAPEMGPRHRGLFNLGNDEARKFMTQFLSEVVREHKLDWLNIDCNIDHLPYWRAQDHKDPTRVGITEIRYVEGLYRMLDEIREAYPGLKISNVSSGGRRIDLEMCKRTTPLWRTDASTVYQEWSGDRDLGAMMEQSMIAGLNHYVPLNNGGLLFEEPYWFRSAFNIGVGFLGDCRDEYYPREVLKAAIAEGKRIRKYFFGNFYPLTKVAFDSTVWHAVQYHLPDEDAGMVLAFRRHEAPRDRFSFGLREIDPEVMYSVRSYHTYSLSSSLAMRGTELRGLIVQIGDMPGSLLVEYSKIG